MNKKKGFRRITILLSIFSGVAGATPFPMSRWGDIIAGAAIGVALPWLVYFVVRWIFRGFTASESIEKLKGGNE